MGDERAASSGSVDAAVARLAAAYRAAGLEPLLPPDDPEAVARLEAAYRRAGIAPPARPDVETALAQIRAEIAPLRLPADVERLWRLVAPWTLAARPFPELSGPDFALDSWRMHRDEAPGMCPRILFPVAYASHAYLLVELDDGDGGGHLFAWGYGGEPFRLQHASVVDLLDLAAEFVEAGRIEVREHDGRLWVVFDPEDRWRDAAAARLAGRPPHPRIAGTTVPEDADAWPAHWRAAEGLDDEEPAPRGATTTVAELLAAAARGEEASGTLRAHAATTVGGPGGRRLRVDDGTGTLDVWAPSQVGAYVRTREVEIDVVVHPGPRTPPDTAAAHRAIAERAAAGDLDGAQAAAVAAHDVLTAPAQAVATGMRAAG